MTVAVNSRDVRGGPGAGSRSPGSGRPGEPGPPEPGAGTLALLVSLRERRRFRAVLAGRPARGRLRGLLARRTP
ncbi:hypothetical protein ACH4JZ_16240 [Streptomyces sp. NPDC017615]|uniref:hypothetical protein n=1 Tax=Streptomyces sp. NPDC017615 TaxID=3365003 RepID=UPI0037ABD07C